MLLFKSNRAQLQAHRIARQISYTYIHVVYFLYDWYILSCLFPCVTFDVVFWSALQIYDTQTQKPHHVAPNAQQIIIHGGAKANIYDTHLYTFGWKWIKTSRSAIIIIVISVPKESMFENMYLYIERLHLNMLFVVSRLWLSRLREMRSQ